LSFCSKFSINALSSYACAQRLAVWLVADFEALSYQVTTTFDTSCAARIPTAPAINYTACWQLVVCPALPQGTEINIQKFFEMETKL